MEISPRLLAHPLIHPPGVHNDHPTQAVFGQHAGNITDCSCLAHPRPTEQQDGASTSDEVCCDGCTAAHSPPHTAREPHDFTIPVAHAADSVQCPVNACPIIVTKIADLESAIKLMPRRALH